MTICATRTLGTRCIRATWPSAFSMWGYVRSEAITWSLLMWRAAPSLRAKDALFGLLALVKELAHCTAEAGHVQAQVGQQLVALGVLDEAVGNTQPDDVARVQAGGVGRLQHGAAKAALQRALLDRDHQRQ